MLALWRLFDPASDAISLTTIRSRIGPRLDFSRAALRSYADGIRSVEPLLKKLEFVPHKFLAHRDAAYTIERIFKEADFRYRDLATLVDKALAFVNVLRAERKRGTYRFSNRTSRDLVRIVRRLHDARESPFVLSATPEPTDGRHRSKRNDVARRERRSRGRNKKMTDVWDPTSSAPFTVDELITGVNVALGNVPLDECPAFFFEQVKEEAKADNDVRLKATVNNFDNLRRPPPASLSVPGWSCGVVR